jgi:hypothetical protein
MQDREVVQVLVQRDRGRTKVGDAELQTAFKQAIELGSK